MSPKKLIKLGLANILLALAAGVYFRELTKYFLKNTVGGSSLVLEQDIMLLHGHAFILLVLLPIAFGVLGFLFLDSSREKTFKIASSVYLVGAYGAWLLMAYKGTMYVVEGAKGKDIVSVNASLMPVGLRESLYGTIHLILAIGALWLAYILWQMVSRKNAPGSK